MAESQKYAILSCHQIPWLHHLYKLDMGVVKKISTAVHHSIAMAIFNNTVVVKIDLDWLIELPYGWFELKTNSPFEISFRVTNFWNLINSMIKKYGKCNPQDVCGW